MTIMQENSLGIWKGLAKVVLLKLDRYYQRLIMVICSLIWMLYKLLMEKVSGK